MTTLRAAYDTNGTLTVSGGPVAVRCYGWVDIDQDEALGFEAPEARHHTERGHRFAGVAEFEGLSVAGIERLGGWTALILPRGSRLIVAAKVALPPIRPVPPAAPARRAPAPAHIEPASPGAKSAARAVARAVLALVLLDLFGR